MEGKPSLESRVMDVSGHLKASHLLTELWLPLTSPVAEIPAVHVVLHPAVGNRHIALQGGACSWHET